MTTQPKERKRFGRPGGVHGGRGRDLEDDFENAVNAAIGERLRGGEAGLGDRLWCSITNVSWVHKNGDEAAYTFRAAGDLVAAVSGRGDYLDWYCTGECEAGKVDDEVKKLMAEQGWRPVGEKVDKIVLVIQDCRFGPLRGAWDRLTNKQRSALRKRLEEIVR